MRVLHPVKPGRYPLIAFSHGAFAAPDRYDAMLRPIAGAGFVVIAPMHADSEDFDHGTLAPPSQDAVLMTRQLDMAFALNPPSELRAKLERRGIDLASHATVAMGHSYGALIAQQAGGATLREANKIPAKNIVGAVVAWSPPGPLPGLIEKTGWASLNVPNLTITGTADILPGFIDRWDIHRAGYENAPQGTASLWIGQGVDHYFGGSFGRESKVDEKSRLLFERALIRTTNFLDRSLGSPKPCEIGEDLPGERWDER